jgi:hypothetical protein
MVKKKTEYFKHAVSILQTVVTNRPLFSIYGGLLFWSPQGLLQRAVAISHKICSKNVVLGLTQEHPLENLTF